jgi:predicted sugar kinase
VQYVGLFHAVSSIGALPAQRPAASVSPRSASTRALEFLDGQGVRCLGQSSWGPTGFAVVESEERARELRSQCEQRLPRAGLEFLVLQARNRGARVLALRGETEAAGR